MARSLKTNGISELRSLRRRVVRQHGLERISRTDRNWLVDHIDEIEAYIIRMEELQAENYDYREAFYNGPE